MRSEVERLGVSTRHVLAKGIGMSDIGGGSGCDHGERAVDGERPGVQTR